MSKQCEAGFYLNGRDRCPECGVGPRDRCPKAALKEQDELKRLRAVEKAARRLIKEGLRLTPDGLIVREHKDNSDPHYELCGALEAIEPLNPKSHS